MNKDTTLRLRVSLKQKSEFVRAATFDGMRISEWLRWLAQRRLDEAAPVMSRSTDEPKRLL